MGQIVTLHNAFFQSLSRMAGSWFLPTFARFAFAAVLLMYFCRSARSKLGDGVFGLFNPNPNAYVQIFPQKAEALGYDPTGFSLFETMIVVAGTATEIILPFLIVAGLLTRLSALGMLAFIAVQSYVDVTGHGVAGKDFGSWFDAASGSLIMDQRLLWVFLLVVLLIRGAGPISVDRFFASRVQGFH